MNHSLSEMEARAEGHDDAEFFPHARGYVLALVGEVKFLTRTLKMIDKVMGMGNDMLEKAIVEMVNLKAENTELKNQLNNKSSFRNFNLGAGKRNFYKYVGESDADFERRIHELESKDYR